MDHYLNQEKREIRNRVLNSQKETGLVHRNKLQPK